MNKNENRDRKPYFNHKQMEFYQNKKELEREDHQQDLEKLQ